MFSSLCALFTFKESLGALNALYNITLLELCQLCFIFGVLTELYIPNKPDRVYFVAFLSVCVIIVPKGLILYAYY